MFFKGFLTLGVKTSVAKKGIFNHTLEIKDLPFSSDHLFWGDVFLKKKTKLWSDALVCTDVDTFFFFKYLIYFAYFQWTLLFESSFYSRGIWEHLFSLLCGHDKKTYSFQKH